MSVEPRELQAEQAHFDSAAEARERSRQVLAHAGAAAGGPAKGAAAVQRAANEHAAGLGASNEAVAFGRIELEDETHYVGKRSILSDDKDTLVIGWQAPKARAFYTATATDPMGVRCKREFTTSGNQIRDFSDTVFADLAGRIAELSGPAQWDVTDALLQELKAARSTTMRDIARTIHAAQYELIQAPADRLMVVQGGPGTGKTALALHRISYLLFNDLDLQPSECLVVGPNPTFIQYVSGVLPGLGDDNIVYRAIDRLGPQRSGHRVETPEVARLKGTSRMARLLRQGLFQRLGLTARTSSVRLGQVEFSREVIESEVRRQAERPVAYNVGRQGLRAFIQRELSVRAPRVSIPSSSVDSALDRIWPTVTPQSFLREFFATRERMLAAGDDTDFRVSEINRLVRRPADRISDEQWSDADVALLDELDFLINGEPTRRFKHIVVDEAQDLSPLQLRSLRRRSVNGSMTVVGDIAQSTGLWSRSSWADVMDALRHPEVEAVEEQLELGYRVPLQVFAFAAQLLPHAAPGIFSPRVVRQGPAEPELVEVETTALASAAVKAALDHVDSGRFVGLVCAPELKPHVESQLASLNRSWNRSTDGALDSALNVVEPTAAKGLEFDTVVVADPESIAASDHGLRLLYIAMTRTTQYLTVVHDGRALPLPEPSNSDETQEDATVYTVEEPPPTLAPAPLNHESAKPRVERAEGMMAGTVQGAASWAAQELEQTLPQDVWSEFLDVLRRELGIGTTELRAWLDAADEQDDWQ